MNIPPFRPIRLDTINQSPIYQDPDTNDSYYLNPGVINYLEKWVGFCPTCKKTYTSRWEVSVPHTKVFLGTRCDSYWKSINKNNPMNVEIKHCGHDESQGWYDVMGILNNQSESQSNNQED